MKERILLCLAHMSGKEMDFINEAFDSNWVVPLGPNVNGFEKDLEKFVNHIDESNNESHKKDLNKKIVALSSGTAAIHLALVGCGVEHGDEVIVQSFTFCASSNPVTYLGATPVFVDSEPETWNIDPGLLEKAIEDRISKTGKKPKAIIPVALYGMPYKIDKILDVANKFNIPVIEDAAEGFGSRFKGQVLGTFGEFGVLSFNGNKMITTSGGGALICPNEEIQKEIMFYATQARENYPYYQHEKIGYNYRMSNICAGIGRGQMTILEEHIRHHKHIQEMYCDLLKDVPGFKMHISPSPEMDPNFWLCTATLDPDLKIKGQENAYKKTIQGAIGGAAGVTHDTLNTHTANEPNSNVEALRMALDAANIEARPLWKPMHLQPVYKNSPSYVNGVSEELFKIGICLPAGPYVKDEHINYIVSIIKESIIK